MTADTMILGENVAYTTDSDVTGLNNNVIVVATSGAGKTMSIIEPRLIETYNSSLIVTLTKRKLVPKYTPMFKKRGYKVYDLNFVQPEKSNVSFDPLAYINSYRDITFLAEAIVKANPRKSQHTNADPYWDDCSISLLSAEIAYILMTKDNPTFADVLEFHEKIEIDESGSKIVTSVDEDFNRIISRNPHCFAASAWKSFRQTPIKTASCIFSTLNTTIDTIFTPELRKMISDKKNIDFPALCNEKTVLFVTSSAVNTSLHCFVNMFYSQAFKALFEYGEEQPNGRLPIPVNVLCDDFAVGCQIISFPEYISIFREKGISVVMLLQSESQLVSIYDDHASTTIINNADTYVFMGATDLKTCRAISEKMNEPLEDILWMPVGEEIIFRRGQFPIRTKRYNITENPIYKEVTEEYNRKIEKALMSK